MIAILYERYSSHHDTNRSFLELLGVVGLVAFPLFYLLRYTGRFPPRYDDFELRAVATVLCLLLASRKWWPAGIKSLYIGYSYLVIFYCFSFMFSFTALKNQGEIFSLVNLIVGAVLTVLLADWRNAVVMQASGYGLSVVTFAVLQPGTQIPANLFVWMPACLLVVVAGALAYFAQKQAELQRMRLLYAGLAGSIAHEMRGPMQKMQSVFDTLERDFLRIGHSQASVSHSRAQIMAMARVVGEGRNAIKLGLQSITVTLQQLRGKGFDTSGFTCLSAVACTGRAVNEFGYESDEQRERVRVVEATDFTFKGDETVLVLVLFNLIKNALYYLPAYPGATVTVAVEAQRITVRDTGPGIAAEKLAHLFEDFQTSGKAEGTGLGLAFCRRAMRAFGGEITCTSQLGEFTQFTLSFPEVPQAEAAAHAQEDMQRAGRLLCGSRVLLVDDEPIQRRATLAKLLALGGSSIIDEAGNGEQALDMLRSAAFEPYDLVVMDINMPALNGYETVRQIRLGAAPPHEQVPVLAHSANPAAEARAKAHAAGMDGFLGKPCRTPELARAIVRLLKDRPGRHTAEDSLSFKDRTVLLAEDNGVNRAIVKGYLEELGMNVMEAKQGFDVLQFLRAGARPVAILMDVEMPGLNGMDTTRQLRAMGDGAGSIPVVALTGHSSSEDMHAARAAGMDGFLSKPVSVESLRMELTRLLGPHPGGIAPAASPPSFPSWPALDADGALLDLERIELLKRMNIMANLLPDGLAQVRRSVATLEEAVHGNNLGAARQALHSLVGVNGEMGARAMFETVKRHSRMVESNAWPSEVGWLEQLKALMDESERALLASFSTCSTSPSSQL